MAQAVEYFEAFDRPALKLADRIWVADEGAQTVCLDGRVMLIDHRPAFLVVQALLRTKGNSMTGEELNDIPTCRGDISKILAQLPDELRAVIRSRPGPAAFYFIQPSPLNSAATSGH